MLYVLLCILVFIIIIQLIGANLIYRIISVIAFIAGYFLLRYLLGSLLDQVEPETGAMAMWVIPIIALIVIFLFSKKKKITEKAKTSISPNKSIFISTLENNEDKEEDDEMYEEARACVIEAGKASTSYLQRKLKLGYARSARLMDKLEERGVIGPADGANPRDVISSNS
jgi:DNA segregation ATPase FtsK/SpoIIIE-like protein